MCATIFLPLTLVTVKTSQTGRTDDKGIFGMHIHQLIPDEASVSWWIPTSIGLPITIALFVVVYFTRFASRLHIKKKRTSPAILPFDHPFSA